ncbi:MAG: amidohydrolase family protein [Saprospiraceae bacterium]|nr:amidohydrolase family protein [Saprospiraceae bacterium]MCF8249105.1 amidohydrolase family protein [Saprospiraceae bacterium]MCF8311127.1 amidohydrolase family protein [Saprospiraceae bacterium]MCF8440217.1 amidohydrolase family protein [Saprospiraceae bacterium]
MTLDTHVHFWQFNPVRDAWIDDSMEVLQQDFLPADLLPELSANGISGCVAVQADQSEMETHFLLQLAENHDFIKKVVGWTDLRSPDVVERLAYFSQFEKLAGFRHIVQGEADVNFLLRKDFCRGIAALEQHGFTYDILVFPHQLGAALEFVRLFPNQKFVIDHLAKPYIKDGYFDGWAALMREIAKHENVYCKVSGMVTEADWQGWKYEDFVPYLDLVAEAFGIRRLMFGSDWPVCLLGGGYGELLGVGRKFYVNFNEDEQSLVFNDNGRHFYNIL